MVLDEIPGLQLGKLLGSPVGDDGAGGLVGGFLVGQRVPVGAGVGEVWRPLAVDVENGGEGGGDDEPLDLRVCGRGFDNGPDAVDGGDDEFFFVVLGIICEWLGG